MEKCDDCGKTLNDGSGLTVKYQEVIEFTCICTECEKIAEAQYEQFTNYLDVV